MSPGELLLFHATRRIAGLSPHITHISHHTAVQGEFHKGIMDTWASVLPIVEAAAATAKNGADGSA
jgi:hypothetical protein